MRPERGFYRAVEHALCMIGEVTRRNSGFRMDVVVILHVHTFGESGTPGQSLDPRSGRSDSLACRPGNRFQENNPIVMVRFKTAVNCITGKPTGAAEALSMLGDISLTC